MRYLGGKSRIAKDISAILSNNIDPQINRFVSLFCGSCAVEAKVIAPNKLLNDKHPYLISMWQALQGGWIPPNKITIEEYKYIKQHLDECPFLSGYVGFACSFGGKWFDGLARNKRGEDYCINAEKTLMKDLCQLKNAVFICDDYKNIEIKPNDVIYADPPYANTTQYSLEKFDSNEFWEYARQTSQSNLLFISEEKAPKDFIPIWEKDIKRQLDINKNNITTKTEKLFVYEKIFNNIKSINESKQL